jgi:hypothetical protein
MKRFIHVVTCLLLAVLSVQAQDGGESLPRLTNKEASEMVKARISPEVIIAKIKVSRCNFNTDPSVLAELKYSGVPDDVLMAMIKAPYGQPQLENKLEPPRTPVTVAPSAQSSVKEVDEADTPRPDRWRGLLIDQSTPEEAIKKLGAPKKDRVGGLRTYPLNKRLTVDHNTDGLRKLYYDNIEGLDHAELVFKDSRLVIIEIHPGKKIEAGNLARIYGVDFVPKISGFDQAFYPKDYERHKGQVYPKNYPVTYYLIAITGKTFVSALVENNSVDSQLFGSRRDKLGDDDSGGFPGKTKIVQIISRTLENRTGEDVLR